MRAKKSPLKLLTFEVLKSEYEFIVPEEDEVIPEHLFSSYPINIEFAHLPIRDSKELIQVFVEIKVNRLKKIAGYSYSIKGMGVFSLNEKNMDKKIAGNLRIMSSLNIIINNLRNIIAQQTAFAPMGVYLLPPIDVQDLLNKKMKKSGDKNKKT